MKQSLQEILNERNVGLSSVFNTLKDHIFSDIDIPIELPHFTDHSYQHYKAIENLLNQIIPDTLKKEFSPQEIFILFSSALFHDIGMALVSEESINSNEVSEKHAESSAIFVIKHAEEFSIDRLLAKIISDICRNQFKFTKSFCLWIYSPGTM